ncbi:MAG TPA: hypothetical protein VMW03_08230 [Candidatus Krumholzibacteriaceae bacterium]|nr:hypothetical protein [Candidatus Krumholzibacteriaceae bacterium]
MKTLVVYYTRTGNTRLVAQAIADRLGADAEEITEPNGRGGPIRFLQSAFESRGKKTPTINPAA